MISVYVAAKFTRRLEMREVADRLWKAGFEITSTWLQEVARLPWMTHGEFWRKLAIKDLCEVAAADIILLDTHMPSNTGGKENEYGFALGQWHHKLLFIVGPKRNVFHELCDRQFDTWDECIVWMVENLKQYTSATVNQDPSDGTKTEETKPVPLEVVITSAPVPPNRWVPPPAFEQPDWIKRLKPHRFNV